MEDLINRVCEVLEDYINEYKSDSTEYAKGTLSGMWQIADSIKNQLYMQGLANKKLDDLIEKADKLIIEN